MARRRFSSLEMFTLRNELKTFLFIGFATGISLFVLVQRNHNIDQRAFSATLPVFSTPTPTAIPPGPVQTITADSPDGAKTLTMKKQQTGELIKYSFSTADKSGAAEKSIFEKEENLSQSLTIPYNAWSPDNAYIFLKESTPTLNNYYVLQTSGDPFPDNVQYINVQDLFRQKLADYTLVDITGWAAPNLLIVNTRTKEGQEVSFWFELPSKAFIQLSTHFD